MSHRIVSLLCVDPIVRKPIKKLKMRFQAGLCPDFFEVKLPGGAYALVDGVDLHREAAIDAITLTLQLSGASEVAIFIHGNCKAQGGSAAFGNMNHERVVCENRLREAVEILVAALPTDVNIHAIYLPLEGEAHVLEMGTRNNQASHFGAFGLADASAFA